MDFLCFDSLPVTNEMMMTLVMKATSLNPTDDNNAFLRGLRVNRAAAADPSAASLEIIHFSKAKNIKARRSSDPGFLLDYTT